MMLSKNFRLPSFALLLGICVFSSPHVFACHWDGSKCMYDAYDGMDPSCCYDYGPDGLGDGADTCTLLPPCNNCGGCELPPYAGPCQPTELLVGGVPVSCSYFVTTPGFVGMGQCGVVECGDQYGGGSGWFTCSQSDPPNLGATCSALCGCGTVDCTGACPSCDPLCDNPAPAAPTCVTARAVPPAQTHLQPSPAEAVAGLSSATAPVTTPVHLAI